MIETTLITAPMFFGHIEIRETSRVEGDRIIYGGLIIERDHRGKEIRRTHHENCSMQIGGRVWGPIEALP
jgi:hypothetical protein